MGSRRCYKHLGYKQVAPLELKSVANLLPNAERHNATHNRNNRQSAMAKRKLFPLVFTALAAGALFLAGLLSEAFGDKLREFFAPIQPHWKWWLGGALVIAILYALWDRWHADTPEEAVVSQRNVTMRGVTESTIITGDGN